MLLIGPWQRQSVLLRQGHPLVVARARTGNFPRTQNFPQEIQKGADLTPVGQQRRDVCVQAVAKGDVMAAQKLEQFKPRYSLNHIVRERSVSQSVRQPVS